VDPVHRAGADPGWSDRGGPLPKRLTRISPEMQASARELGAGSTARGTRTTARPSMPLRTGDSREGASRFFELWGIADEPGEIAVRLEGDVGLVPDP
jgi:hypothetical protein